MAWEERAALLSEADDSPGSHRHFVSPDGMQLLYTSVLLSATVMMMVMVDTTDERYVMSYSQVSNAISYQV
jgi:hypothetical protein